MPKMIRCENMLVKYQILLKVYVSHKISIRSGKWENNKLKTQYARATKVTKMKVREWSSKKYRCWPTGGNGSFSKGTARRFESFSSRFTYG